MFQLGHGIIFSTQHKSKLTKMRLLVEVIMWMTHILVVEYIVGDL